MDSSSSWDPPLLSGSGEDFERLRGTLLAPRPTGASAGGSSRQISGEERRERGERDVMQLDAAQCGAVEEGGEHGASRAQPIRVTGRRPADGCEISGDAPRILVDGCEIEFVMGHVVARGSSVRLRRDRPACSRKSFSRRASSEEALSEEVLDVYLIEGIGAIHEVIDGSDSAGEARAVEGDPRPQKPDRATVLLGRSNVGRS